MAAVRPHRSLRESLGRVATRAVQPVSGLGWAVLAAAALGLAAGRRWGWVELTVVGAALAAAVLAGVVLTVGRSAFAVDLELSDHRVVVGRRAIGRLTVTSTHRRRLLPAQVELPVGAATAVLHLPSLAAGATHEDVFAIPTSRRAVVVVGPVRSVRGDPLGLVRRRVRWTDPVDLYVHPVTVALTGAASGVLRDLEGQATRVVSDSDMSFHALRDYVPGDDRRHIHWKSSARTGALMVRQFEDTRRTHTAIAVSAATSDYADPEEFELAIATAASLGVQTLRDERDLTVLAGEGQLTTATPPRLLDDFSALELSRDGRGSDELARWVAREAGDASVAVLVTGSVPDRTDLRAGVAHLPAGVRTLVLSCRPGAELEVVTHGRLSVATIGALPDLPRLLRRVVAG